MYGFRLIFQFYRDIRSQKLRSFLTIFGITWGTVAIVLLLAFGTGLQRHSIKAMHGMGESIVIVWAQRTTKPYQGLGIGRQVRLREEDADLLRERVEGIKAISPEYIKWGVKLRYGRSVSNTSISGVYPSYEDLRNTIPQPRGRFIDRIDLEGRRRVIFIGNKLKEKLFGEEDAVGRTIYVNGIPFLVIGVMMEKTQSSSYSGMDENRAFMPATTFASTFGYRYLNNLVYGLKDPTLSKEVKRKVYEVLGRKHRFDPGDKEALMMWDTTEIDKFIFYFSLVLNLLLGSSGVFTLMVGGIGVANIMYIVVRERTREIGIKMAVGAKGRHILFQFLLETLFIVSIGGVTGFLISSGIVKAVSLFPVEKYIGTPTISTAVWLSAVLVLGVVGFLAGYFPARRAASLNPVEALAVGH